MHFRCAAQVRLASTPTRSHHPLVGLFFIDRVVNEPFVRVAKCKHVQGNKSVKLKSLTKIGEKIEGGVSSYVHELYITNKTILDEVQCTRADDSTLVHVN